MTMNMTTGLSPFWRQMRGVIWGGAICLILLPLLAMQFTDEVKWTLFDFVVMGMMLSAVCGAFEVVLRAANSNVYMVAAGVAVAAAFLMTWINLAVGIIGSENNPANRVFFGVLAIGMIGTALARLKPMAMVRTLRVVAIAQALATVISLVFHEIPGLILSCVFVAMWLLSAHLFQKAEQQEVLARGLPQGDA